MQIEFLSKEFLAGSIDQFTGILKEFPGEYWQEDHFLTDLPGKWKFSICIKMPDNSVGGYIIASERNNGLHIHKFMVRQDLRSKGFGEEAFTFLQKYCKDQGKEVITLKVEVSNPGAIRFYHQQGFKKISEEPGLLILSKTIK